MDTVVWVLTILFVIVIIASFSVLITKWGDKISKKVVKEVETEKKVTDEKSIKENEDTFDADEINTKI